MSQISSYHNLAQYSPGSYIHALKNTVFPSLAQQAQCAKILSRLHRLNIKAKLGEAWFPIVRSVPPNPIVGTLICINVQKKGRPLDTEKQEHVRKWLSSLLNEIPVEIPQLYIDNMPPSWEIKGDSWGLAAIIACISSFLQQKPQQDVLCSGVLCLRTKRLNAVSAQSPKRILCSWEAPQTTPIIVKKNTDINSILKRFFCVDWKQKLLARLRITPRALAEEALNKYRQRNGTAALRMAENVLSFQNASTIPQILGHFVIGSVNKHVGKSLESEISLTKARQLILQCKEIDQLDFYLRFRLEANLGIAMLHNLNINKGIQVVEQGLRELTEIFSYHRDINWRSVTLRLAGTLRWLYIANGELNKAEHIQKEWPLYRAKVPQHLCRALYSLTDVYWRKKEPEKASIYYTKAKEAFSDVRPADRAVTQRYLWCVVLCGVHAWVRRKFAERCLQGLDLVHTNMHRVGEHLGEVEGSIVQIKVRYFKPCIARGCLAWYITNCSEAECCCCACGACWLLIRLICRRSRTTYSRPPRSSTIVSWK